MIRVLIADDHVIVRSGLKQLFALMGDIVVAGEATNGSEVLEALQHPENFDLILLDLNMPKMDGREVLAEIKSDDELKRIPVVIFTISKAEEDILKAYDLHTNCYITKPLDLNRFLKVIQSIEDFWLTIVRLPKE